MHRLDDFIPGARGTYAGGRDARMVKMRNAGGSAAWMARLRIGVDRLS
jgi:hypothetical protein